jgi:hypothetical protein
MVIHGLVSRLVRAVGHSGKFFGEIDPSVGTEHGFLRRTWDAPVIAIKRHPPVRAFVVRIGWINVEFGNK